MKDGKLLAVVPVHNEEDSITDTVNGLKEIDLIDEILIVNDGSTDNTQKIIETLDVSYITFEKNMGKGYAMKKAIKDMEYDYIAFVDGDLGKTSKEMEKLIIPVVSKEVDFTIAKFPKAPTKGGFRKN